MTLEEYHDLPLPLEKKFICHLSRKENSASVFGQFMCESLYRDENDFDAMMRQGMCDKLVLLWYCVYILLADYKFDHDSDESSQD